MNEDQSGESPTQASPLNKGKKVFRYLWLRLGLDRRRNRMKAGTGVIAVAALLAVVTIQHILRQPAASKKALRAPSTYPLNNAAAKAAENKTSNTAIPAAGTHPSTAPADPVLNDGLSHIQVQLVNIEQMLSRQKAVVNLDQVRQDLHALAQQAGQVAEAGNKEFNGLHQQIAQLSAQLKAMQTETRHQLTVLAAKQATPKGCLTASHLPFQVESVDMINGQPVVSVQYDHAVTPLEKGFSLAGWTLQSADYTAQAYRFTRAKTCVTGTLANG